MIDAFNAAWLGDLCRVSLELKSTGAEYSALIDSETDSDAGMRISLRQEGSNGRQAVGVDKSLHIRLA
jgi:hypothetical protein